LEADIIEEVVTDTVYFKFKVNQDAYQHDGVTCDHRTRDTFGIRYKCLMCEDFDVCGKCMDDTNDAVRHDTSHFFLKMRRPLSIDNFVGWTPIKDLKFDGIVHVDISKMCRR